MNKIKVLIVEDSKVITEILKTFFQDCNDIEVVGHAGNGEKAVKLTKQLKPDVITMDICMPILDGFEATRQIMRESPTPIIVISSKVNEKSMNTTFNALDAGALAVLEKPADLVEDAGFNAAKRQVVNAVRTYAGIKLVTRRHGKPVVTPRKTTHITPKITSRETPMLLAIGCSTGGPEALKSIFENLPNDFPLPIVVVQHIAKGFVPGMVHWLQQYTKIKVCVATQYKVLEPATAYFAPDDFHLTIQSGEKPKIYLENSPPIGQFKPAATRLFSSIATSYPGQAIGIILTGMGRDGAEGLLAMHQTGCHTIAQDEVSSVVFGMPAQAQALQAVDAMVNLNDMTGYLQELLSKLRRTT